MLCISTLLAFISLAIVPIPFAFYKWGPRIRARSAAATASPEEKIENITSSS